MGFLAGLSRAGAGPPSAAVRAVLAAAYVATTALRVPGLLLTPRFWGEEATVYYAVAHNRPWHEVMLSTDVGYYGLFNSVTALAAARLLPVEWAPTFTTAMALILQVLPATLLLLLSVPAFGSGWSLALALAAMLFTQPSREIWLNTTNAQTFLGLASVIVLLSDPARGWRWAVQMGVVVLAGLTGLVSALLAPFFWAGWLRARTRPRLVLAATVTGCAGFHAVTLLLAGAHPRQVSFDLATFLYTFATKGVLLQYTPWEICSAASLPLYEGLAAGRVSPLVLLATVLYLGALSTLVARSRSPEALLLLGSGGLLFLAGFAGSVSNENPIREVLPNTNERYYYLPNLLVALSLIAAAHRRAKRSLERRVLLAMIIWTTAFGAFDFFRFGGVTGFSGPDWRAEVAAWRRDPGRSLAVWPEGWRISLTP